MGVSKIMTEFKFLGELSLKLFPQQAIYSRNKNRSVVH